jgi:GAF domain-containing protein
MASAMSEAVLDLRGVAKARAYEVLNDHARAVLSGMNDPVAAMATVSSLVHHAFGFLWTGFYRVVEPGLLRVGPYQGALGCLEIPFGKGVCGTVARERRAVVVPDVSKFPGHISCDSRSRSEIVLPVFGRDGNLFAVFDVDSDQLNAFDENDERGLAAILAFFSDRLT